jgi:hypothetical protein
LRRPPERIYRDWLHGATWALPLRLCDPAGQLSLPAEPCRMGMRRPVGRPGDTPGLRL